MTDTKRLKRFLLIFCAAALVALIFALVHSLRGVTSAYQRHPEKFQVVAEYFCAHKPDGFPLSVYRSDLHYGSLPDEEWPQEVSDAVRNIFRNSDCHCIYTSQTRAGVSYCVFSHRTSNSQGEFGIVYTPRDSGHEILGDIFDLPVSHWSALSDHWFSFTLVSYDDYNSCG